MGRLPILVANRLIRLIGNSCKLLSYPLYRVFPRLRFSIPEYSRAKIQSARRGPIPRTIWQTNFTDRVTLPVYLNYLLNRLLSLSSDYYYLSTQARGAYLQQQAAPEIYAAYERLNDGAAQADLWRLFVLWQQGGVYIDIDASLVWGLDTLLGERDALFIGSGGNAKFENYFIAAAPGHPDMQRAIERVLHNIDNYAGEGVYACTGPAVLQALFKGRDDVQAEERKYACIQGTFVNDYFQYLDHPGKKWTDIDPHDLLKAPGEQQQGERE